MKINSEEIKRIYELSPLDGRASFYGKAKVLEVENGYYLQSYGTKEV